MWKNNADNILGRQKKMTKRRRGHARFGWKERVTEMGSVSAWLELTVGMQWIRYSWRELIDRVANSRKVEIINVRWGEIDSGERGSAALSSCCGFFLGIIACHFHLSLHSVWTVMIGLHSSMMWLCTISVQPRQSRNCRGLGVDFRKGSHGMMWSNIKMTKCSAIAIHFSRNARINGHLRGNFTWCIHPANPFIYRKYVRLFDGQLQTSFPFRRGSVSWPAPSPSAPSINQFALGWADLPPALL